MDSGRPVASGLDAAIKERQYADNTTVLAQLGVIKAPTRPVMAAATGAPTVVVSTGSDTERANVETFRANMKAFNDHDVKTLADMNAADGVFHDYTQPKDVDGKGNIAALGELFKGFPWLVFDSAAFAAQLGL